MPNLTAFTLDEILRLPPRIIGKIRWKKSIGMPTGDPCTGFDILVEEHTATQYADGGGGVFVPLDGTGIWKVVLDAVSCRAAGDEGDYHAVSFEITGLHYNAPLDGKYRVTPSLKGNWGPGSLFFAILGYRAIDPISYYCVLTKDAPVAVIEFEVIRRSFFSGRRLA